MKVKIGTKAGERSEIIVMNGHYCIYRQNIFFKKTSQFFIDRISVSNKEFNKKTDFRSSLKRGKKKSGKLSYDQK